MAKKPYQIPFDTAGNQQSYLSSGAIMKDNFVFEETMTYRGYDRGRSSATLLFMDSKGKHYSMFLSDFDALMRKKGLTGDTVKGRWTFVKKGMNYGLALEDK